MQVKTMYKVDPKHIIPALTGDALQEKLDEFSSNTVSDKLQVKFHKVIDYLNNKAAGKPPKATFNRIYGLIDKVMEETVYPYAMCQSGCAHCCKIPVSVSAIEAGYIHQVTGKKLIGKPVDDIGYCPFLDLDTAKCSIYEVRPIECRSFASMDSLEGCEDPTIKHMMFNARQNGMLLSFKKWTDFQSKAIAKKENLPAEEDIRFWFGS
ncbi:MAG: hypothetical protein COA84_14260 [Robiginitomaculum sp.]|nr:MAG: hypothetical protein COA84_14260 [Robiginitomaculum sp.]